MSLALLHGILCDCSTGLRKNQSLPFPSSEVFCLARVCKSFLHNRNLLFMENLVLFFPQEADPSGAPPQQLDDLLGALATVMQQGGVQLPQEQQVRESQLSPRSCAGILRDTASCRLLRRGSGS